MLILGACSTNPATGKKQFTAFMSPEREKQIGAQEHQKIIKQYGLYDDAALNAYVGAIGARVTAQTERPDIQYKFFIIDSPIVNAFALPGGYIYVSRGLLALAQNEAELASVLGHEAGHITARHSAERYSHGVVASLGSTIASIALNSAAANQALGVGSQLYLSGYSRSQENEADTLGLRYADHGNYDPYALSEFLKSLEREKQLSSKINGGSSNQASYFSTHPPTQERVNKTKREASVYDDADKVAGQANYLKAIDGMPYGDSIKQGFMRHGTFYHPEMGFAITPPESYQIINQPSQIVMKDKSSQALILFDMVKNNARTNASNYLQNIWMKGENLSNAENINVNGMGAATAQFQGQVNGQPMTIRVMAIEWGQGRFARFQVAIPKQISSQSLEALKTATYSFRSLKESEKRNLKPARIRVITSDFGDTAEKLAGRQVFTDGYSLERFRLLNAMGPNEGVMAGRQYKLVVY